MKSVKKRRIRKALQPLTLRPRKKHSFRTPIPPCSVVRWESSPRGSSKKDIGRRFRVGYYSWKDGLDCIWLVNDEGKYEQTIDHDSLQRNFVIESVSSERSFYGRNKPELGPLNK